MPSSMGDPANFLAVDLGASSGRVLLGRWDGARFGLRELHRFPNGGVSVRGHLHWDVLRLWQELQAGLARYAAEYDAPLAGIGVDSWAVDFGLLDGHGDLLGNPYHYRDRRTDGVPERVFARLPWPEVFARTGTQLLPFNTLYQLASMRATNDPQLAAAETLLLMPDLLGYWLTGRKAAEYTNATTTQCLDCHSRTWANDLLARLDLPSGLLPPLIDAGTRLGELLPEVAAAAGLDGAVPVFAPGTHDTASAVAAIPGLDERSAYISSGTWSLVGLELGAPIVSAAARHGNVTNEGGVYGTVRLLKNVTGLWLLQECQRRWQQEGHDYSWDELSALAGATAPLQSLVDPDAPAFLHPTDMPSAILAHCRERGEPAPGTVGAVVRCCLESVALKYRAVLDSLERLAGRRIATIRVVGGGSRNQMLCQFTADACGRPVVAGPAEATALGNILVQAIAAGALPDLATGRRAVAASVDTRQYDPQPADTDRWDDAFARFQSLYTPGDRP
jgi:rhamnulokinase